MALVASLPLSYFGIGLCTFLLFLNWLAEWNWQEKWNHLKDKKQGLLFAGLFIVCLLGLIKTENWSVAANNLLSKLPLFFLPILVTTSKPLSQKELLWIYKTFIFSTVFCCCGSIFYWLTHPVEDIRQISIFINHIRFSLCIVLSIVFCGHILKKDFGKKQWRLWLYSGLILFQGSYLFIAQTLTGIVILAVLLLVYLGYMMVKLPAGKLKFGIVGLTTLLLIGGIVYFSVITYQYFHDDDKQITATQTALGNAYEFEESSIIENGRRVGYYVCRPELQSAWALRSDTLYNELIEQTLIRYLNSKGLHKDYAAVMALSDTDIENVEKKIANYDYTQAFGLRRSLYQTYFGFSIYQKSNYIEGSSLLQRLELWKASVAVIRDNWLLGVGIGDYKEALDQQLQAQHSSIADRRNRGSHNQFLTFWLMGGIFVVAYFLFVLVYPFVKMRDRISLLYVSLFLLIFLSMLAEDTLETITGRMLYAVFVPLMLFSEKRD